MTKSSSSNYGRSLRLAALVGFLCLSCSPAQAVPYGVNVLVNGNAEQGPFSATGAALPGPTPVPGWTISSAFTVVDYKASSDSSGFPEATDSGPPDRLLKFFAGGNAAVSTATQQIDLSGNATDISQGKVTYDLSGWLGGFAAEADNAVLQVEFFNGATILGGNSIGPVTPADRSNSTGLLFRIINRAVPPTATSALVTLTMTRFSNTFNDGYADSLSLVFRAPMVVTTTADSGAGSLRAAITAANTITFDPNVFAPAGAPYFISLLTELPALNSSMNIVGPGANVLTIQRSAASGRFRIFTADFFPFGISYPVPLSSITISGLTLRNGLLSSTGIGAGAGILNFANLTLNDCVITGNQTTSFSGGGIYSTGGVLILNRTVVSNNISGSDAGGIYSDGPLGLNSSTVSGNQATRSGGGISTFNNVTTIDKCTISGNSAGTNGGGLVNQASGSGATANMTLTNCTVSGNSAATHGGGIYDTGSSGSTANLTLHNCTISGNNISGGGGSGLYVDTPGGGVCTFDNSIFKSGTSGFFNVGGGTAQFGSGGHNITNDSNGGDGGTGPFGTFGGPGDIRNTDPLLGPLQDNGGPTLTHALLPGSPAVDQGNTNLTTDQRGFIRPVDNPAIPNAAGGNGSDIGAFEVTPGLVANVSTRLPVGTGDSALFEGFIVQGPAGSTKKIIVRAIGPSLALPPFGVTDALANPTLEIHDANKVTIATNNDWRTTQLGGIITADQSAEISASGVAPTNDLESAIIANLAPGSYTAIVQGFGNTVGTGVVDAYDVSAASPARVANFSTRGLIQPGDKLMIAGFITQNGPVKAVVLAIGPSLAAFGITNALPDTTLQLRDGNGAIVVENDDWKVRTNGTSQQAEMEATGLQPTNDLEAGFVTTLQPGLYTAQVRGKPESTGIGVVQVYFLP